MEAAQRNLLFNGSFELDANRDGKPDGWRAVGRSTILQRLRRVKDPERGWVARLECDRFEPGFPDSHAMLAQYGRVGVQKGKWYSLTGWIRAERLKSGTVEIALVNCGRWSSVGLQEVVSPSDRWTRFTIDFRATEDLRPEESRFQIYFRSTGILEVDDLQLTERAGPPTIQRLPTIQPVEKGNWLPNSSLECGPAGWGAWSPDERSWGTHVFRQVGIWDTNVAWHGRASWKLSLCRDRPLRAFFDYFDPTATPLRCLLIGPTGWLAVEPGRVYVFSAYVKADQENVPVCAAILSGKGHIVKRVWQVGTNWHRVWWAWKATARYVFPSIGLDLSQSRLKQATLWIDALQWESGRRPSAYRPRGPVEAFWEPERASGIFPDPEKGIEVRLRAWNDSSQPQRVQGTLALLDAWQRKVYRQQVRLELPPHSGRTFILSGLQKGKTGFYRLEWHPEPKGPVQKLRLALIRPVEDPDSLFGMNHAFGWSFLIRLTQEAGIRWWRDWSVQWRIVQPAPNHPFDFRRTDPHIERVVEQGGRVLMLLPFPSAPWIVQKSPSNRPSKAQSPYLRERSLVAQKPKDLAAFQAYVAAAVKHYRGRISAVEILNEPLYTSYALPQREGWTLSDYLELLKAAYQAVKQVDRDLPVVGGIAAPPDHELVRAFIERGGLRWCDVMNLHLYPHRGDPETYDSAFASCAELMRRVGPVRPIWVTEIGVYADDDPAFRPFRISDSAMNRALRPTELRAAADLVKFAAVMVAHGVRKIFYHAGTCAALNEESVGNLFFEYGGRPRILYAAQAVLASWMGPDVRFLRKWHPVPGLVAYDFVSHHRVFSIVWNPRSSGTKKMELPPGWRAFDLMGNPLERTHLSVDWVPIYLEHKTLTH